MKQTKVIINQVLSHKTTIIKNAIAAILMAAIFAFEGCFNFATMSWDYHALEEPSLWVRSVIKVAIMLAVKAAMLLVFTDVARNTNMDLFKAQRTNEEYMRKKGPDFPEYVEKEVNPSIRVEEWKKDIDNKLIKLETHAKHQDRALYFSDKEVEKKHNKYCIKRAELEFLKSDEYIENNKELLFIKDCPIVDPAVFDKPIKTQKEDKWQMTSKGRSAIAISLIIGSIWIFVWQAIWNATGFDKLEEYNFMQIWIGMIMDFIFICIQCIMGILKAFTTVNDNEVVPYGNRNRVLLQYIYHKNKDNESGVRDFVDAVEKQIKEEISSKAKLKEEIKKVA